MTPPTDKLLRIDGQDIYVADQGRGPALLLVHGFPLDHSMWSHQLSGLSDTFRLIAPDLPGCGKNGRVTQLVTMSAAADFLAAVLDQLELDQPLIYCGLSMGGYIGWEFCSRHRDRVSHLVMCDTRAAADSAEVARGRELMATQVEQRGTDDVVRSMIPKLFAAESIASNRSVVDATRAVMEATAASTIAAYQRGMALREDFVARLGQLDLPTLFLCGGADTITPPAEMQQLAQAVPAATYVEIPGAGHLAPLEQPDQVNQAMRQFLWPQAIA